MLQEKRDLGCLSSIKRSNTWKVKKNIWNKKVFKNIFEKKEIQRELEEINEQIIAQGLNSQLFSC